MTKTVPEMLRQAAGVYEERNALYKDNYKRFGHVMAALFPEGFSLRTADEWNRLGLMVQSVAKLTRAGAQWNDGGHDDSLLDLSVYAQMWREVEAEARGE